MRIAILTNAFPPLSRGGAGRIAGMQADWLMRHGHTVKVWVPEPFPEKGGRFDVEAFTPRTSVQFGKLGKTIAPGRLLFHLEDSAPNLKACDQIRNWKPDVLITHNLTGCGWGTPKLVQAGGVKWIHVLHDVQMFEPSGQLIDGDSDFKRLWHNFWGRRRAKALAKPDLVISPSEWLWSIHRKKGLLEGVEHRVLPNPVNFPEGLCEARHESVRKVIYLGRLSEDKGAKVLVDAWRSFETRLGELVLIGDGPLRDKIENLKDSSIKLLGELDHREAMSNLYAADLLVMPSIIMENQPTVLLEAIAAGINVVASDVGGVKEMLGSYGRIVPPGDVDVLAAAMEQSLSAQTQSDVREEILGKHNEDRVMAELVEMMGVAV